MSVLKFIPTILCGGAGSRLWPVSREQHPKPFIRLADGQSLLQKAWLRGTCFPDVENIVTITNRELLFKTADEYREAAGSRNEITNSYILEPFGRNTAPAIAAAALHIAAAHGDDAVMLVLAADHLIADQDAFVKAVLEATQLAREGRLVTFGIEPDSPETGYGYIEAEGNAVVRFVEKPCIEDARRFLASGRHLWNSGMFCFSAGTLIREMSRHCPVILSSVRTCIERSSAADGRNHFQLELEASSFDQVPSDSIDYALMEKSDIVSVVRCDIGWSDIGSWNALGNLLEPDAANNRVEGAVQLHDVTNCYIRSADRVVGAVGIRDVVVIDTPDALLVAGRDRVQDVKHIYSALKQQNHGAYKLHRTVHRPWGTYTVLEEGPRFKIKRIEVNPGASLSLQLHHHRSEHWIVVSGVARVVNVDQESLLNTNQSTYIPALHAHRLSNPGDDTLVIIEVQCGDYLGEDDIVRLEDKYGRVPNEK